VELAYRDQYTVDMTLDQTFCDKVLLIVGSIPHGRISTYGAVALMAGYPRRARHVGHLLRGISEDTAQNLPWHRVVNSSGKLSTYKVGTGDLQRVLLEAEGVAFDKSGKLELKKLMWWTDE
jgi:methylated-DNA-protein-cysteine methyltransferase related protein